MSSSSADRSLPGALTISRLQSSGMPPSISRFSGSAAMVRLAFSIILVREALRSTSLWPVRV